MSNKTNAKSRKGLWLSFATLGLIGTLVAIPFQPASQAVVSTNDSLAQITSSHKAGFENYDIRQDDKASDKIDQFRNAIGGNLSKVEIERKKMVAGEDALRSRIPHVKVEYNEDLRTPEVIAPDIYKGYNTLTGANTGKNSEILRNFVKENNNLIGVSDEQANQLKVIADYTNPDGVLSFATLEQRINDIPVFRGEIKAGFTKDGAIVRVINNLAPGANYDSLSTEFGDASNAVRAAFQNVPREMKAEDLQANAAESNGKKAKFGTGDWATTAEKMYFATEPGVVRPAWRVLEWESVSAYYVIVDAETGTMLWRKNITEDQLQSATYNVYTNNNAMIPAADSPAPLSPGPIDPTLGTQGALLNRVNVTRVGNEAPYTFNNNGWITDGGNTTDGNAVEAGVDRVAPDGVDAPQTGSPNRIFTTAGPVWNPGPGSPAPGDDPLTAQAQRGAVIQMFYVMNLYHDEMYRLGLTEQAFNFQQDNFGRGGTGNDRVSAEGQDSSGTNNANMSTPADGGRGKMQMYIWTGPTPDYDGTADADVIIHEITHGTSNRLHGNTAGLTANGSRGMGEGWSDFYAHVMLSEPTDNVNGVYGLGGYATYLVAAGFTGNYYYGIRRFPKAPIALVGPNGKPHNPLTFRYINAGCDALIGTPTSNPAPNSAYPRGPIGVTGSCDQVHNAGEVWSSALWEVRTKYVNRLGWAVGNRRALQHVTDGMKLAPLNPNMLQERDAIVTAAGVTSSADKADAIAGFALRGMGFSAVSTPAASTAVVTEAFDLPNAVVASTGFLVSDVAPGGDGDGSFEPGETLTLTVPVTNNTGATVTNVTAAVTGGGSNTYGSINDGQTVTRTITYTVPANAVCGSIHDVSITVTSNLGAQAPVTRSFRLGTPAGGAPVDVNNTASFVLAPDGTAAAPAPATPYTSSINVSGVPATQQVNIKVRLNGYTHTFPADNDFMLVGPGGQKFALMSDMGGGGDVAAINLTLSDTATATLSTTQLVTGEFKPGNTDTADIFPAPAPAGTLNNPAPAGTATLASTFGTIGSGMNGTWSLYIVDDAGGDTGALSGGWGMTFEGNDYICSFSSTVKSPADFDGDSKTDVSVFRPSNGTWYVQRSTAGFAGVQFGANGDTTVPGDYDGDNKTDYAIFRPTNTVGVADFYILNSATNTVSGIAWGNTGDIPVIGDYTGDGKDDFAIVRPTDYTWYILPAGGGAAQTGTVGQVCDRPVVMDYDGDGRTDIAGIQGSGWFIRKSSTGTVQYINWGVASDKFVPGDYDNDNKDDVAVFRNGQWIILLSTTNQPRYVQFGQAGDIAVPGDYDGDGDDEPAVYRNGSWYIQTQAGGIRAESFGTATDVAIPNRYMPQ